MNIEEYYRQSSETPTQKAQRLGVKLIPKIEKSIFAEPETIAVCGECNREIKDTKRLDYCCPNSNCPCGRGRGVITG